MDRTIEALGNETSLLPRSNDVIYVIECSSGYIETDRREIVIEMQCLLKRDLLRREDIGQKLITIIQEQKKDETELIFQVNDLSLF
jgi:hypothetical protein